MAKLEYAIHQYKGNMTKVLLWLERLGITDTSITLQLEWADFIVYKGGGVVEVIKNPQYKYY